MSIEQIFGLQFSLSLIVFGLLAIWYARPWLRSVSPEGALFWLTVPHAFRHIGLVFLVPGAVGPDLPDTFSGPAGYGDLAAGVLAILALVALHQRWSLMIPLTWLYSIVGIVDLANALTRAEAIPHFQSAWYIPTFIVPLLLVSHTMVVARLIGRWRSKSANQPDPAH